MNIRAAEPQHPSEGPQRPRTLADAVAIAAAVEEEYND